MPDNHDGDHCPYCGHCPAECWTRANAQQNERAVRRPSEPASVSPSAAPEVDR